MRIFLHIGLHKTGTTFLQHHVFPKLDKDLCLYNPAELLTPIMHSMILQDMEELNKNDIGLLKKTIAISLRNIHVPVLLLSNELMSQNMYSLNYSQRAELLGDLFPDAEIILFLRYQTDWLKSVYRQALQEGNILPVEEFFRLDGRVPISGFQESVRRDLKLTMDPLKLNLPDMVKTYQTIFGKEKTHILFYEDLMNEKAKCLHNLCQAMGLSVPDVSFSKSVNRSYSALSCMLTLKLYQIADLMHLRFIFPNTIKFYKYMRGIIRSSSFKTAEGPLRIRDDFLEWSFVKKNFDKGSVLKVLLKKSLRRARFFSLWRFLMQDILDKVVYIDWDVFEKANIKDKLDEYYYEQNKRLSLLLSPRKLPEKYIKKD